MKYLVTGAGGFVSGTLVRDLLAQGHEVRGMDNFHRGNCDGLIPLTVHSNFEFMRGDITNEKDVDKALDGVDGIFHLAAIVGNPACVQNPTLSNSVNYDGVDLFLRKKNNEQRFVFCSTECVYGSAENYNENEKCFPSSLYANHKRAAEYFVEATENSIAFRFAAAMGLSTTPRLNLLVNTLVYEALTNKSLVLFEQDVCRNFISVKDMSRVLQFGMSNQLTHPIYNAGNISSTKREIGEYISKKTGCHLFFGEVNKDPDKRDKKLDCSLLHSEGFEFKYGLEETIDELIKGLPLVNIKTVYN